MATVLLSAVLDDRQPLDGLLDGPALAGLETRDRALARAILGTALRRHGEIDRALARAILGTALRRHGEIDRALGKLIDKGPPRRAGRLMRFIEIAAAQILFMEVPAHAAVSIAIDQIAADDSARHFKGFANAVLRRLAREQDTILAGEDAGRLDTPDWLWARWSATYGEALARRIAEAHLVEPSLDLTVKGDPAVWAERLGGVVLPSRTVRLVPAGPVEALPGYAEGEWWVQDAAAALASGLLGDVRGKRVADLCAAPGGKTAALAHAGAHVTAVDISAPRLVRLKTNLARLHLSAETVAADILAWTPAGDERFDAVLLDAPCSATGTIRRHPDVAWLKRPDDIAALASLQARMIERATTFLKPGGTLLFCTCSLEPEEGEAQLAAARALGLELVAVTAEEVGGIAEVVTPAGTVRTLPHHLASPTPRLAGLDGFFMMRLRKV